MTKEFDEIDIDEYKAIQLQEYKGVYGVLALDLKGGENTSYYKKWVFLSEWRNGRGSPSTRKIPMAVRLGDRQTAITALEEILKQLRSDVGG